MTAEPFELTRWASHPFEIQCVHGSLCRSPPLEIATGFADIIAVNFADTPLISLAYLQTAADFANTPSNCR
eukprot:2490646-Rhodomonas_salina.2